MEIQRPRWELIIELIRKNEYKNIVEVGVGNGTMAARILGAVGEEINKYIMIDHAFRNEGITKLEDDYSWSTFWLADSSESAKRVKDESIDLVYIDATHKYESVLADINAWYPKIRQGGVISGHDYGDSYHSEVVRAVRKLFPRHKMFLEIDSAVSTSLIASWVVYKGEGAKV